MGYNIRPFFFFIEIYNNDKSDRKEYFGERFFSFDFIFKNLTPLSRLAHERD